jgi:excisionase family DNA binding protein
MEQGLTMTAAAERLGITRTTLRRLVREGELPTLNNPLDRRERLIPVSAIEQLERESPRSRARPRTIGIVSDGRLQSKDVDEYLRAHWQPE